jgi:hypothetical protein
VCHQHIEKAPYHRPVFRNDQVMLLSVYLPPGAPLGPEVYHTHSLDQFSVLVDAATHPVHERAQRTARVQISKSVDRSISQGQGSTCFRATTP